MDFAPDYSDFLMDNISNLSSARKIADVLTKNSTEKLNVCEKCHNAFTLLRFYKKIAAKKKIFP